MVRAPTKKAEPRPAPTTHDVAVKPALVRATPVVDLSRSANTDQRPIILTSGALSVVPQRSVVLQRSVDPVATAVSETVIDAAGATSAASGASAASVERGPTPSVEKPVARPPATDRVLRRMNAARPSFDADMQACADEHGTRDATTLTLQLSVSPEGAIEDVHLAPTSVAPERAPLFTCVMAAISKAQFGRPGRAGASVALRVTVPAAKAPAQPEAVATEPNAPASAASAAN